MRSSAFGLLVLLLLAIVVAIFLFTSGSRPRGGLRADNAVESAGLPIASARYILSKTGAS
jgi:hypothetical protein